MSDNNLEMPDAPAQELNGQDLQETTCFGLTKRERACIELRIPESGDEELDALIAKAQRRDMAAMAMQGLLANSSSSICFWAQENGSIAKAAVNHAIALDKELAIPGDSIECRAAQHGA